MPDLAWDQLDWMAGRDPAALRDLAWQLAQEREGTQAEAKGLRAEVEHLRAQLERERVEYLCQITALTGELGQVHAHLAQARAELAAITPGWAGPAALQQAYNEILAIHEAGEAQRDRLRAELAGTRACVAVLTRQLLDTAKQLAAAHGAPACVDVESRLARLGELGAEPVEVEP